MNFYDNLERILKEKKVKKIELQQELGITKSNLHSWKEGHDPSAKYIKMLAEYLCISADELLGIKPKIEPKTEAKIEPKNQNETEIIELIRKLPDREQIKWIGRLEQVVNS